MNLDIRTPTGLLFGLIGLILVAFGLISDKAIYQRSLGININLWWGLVLLVFAAVMLFLAWRAAKAAKAGRQFDPNQGK
jgi:protein-S-isoprenylcysteine O-methyltransferase Ste14